MSPRKLTDSDKQEILQLYRTPQETTSTLAERYQVSSSTISRFLKTHLAENEYEELIQQKRLSRTPAGAAQVMSQFTPPPDEPEAPLLELLSANEPEELKTPSPPAPNPRRTRRRSSAPSPETAVEKPILSTPAVNYFEVDEEEDEDSVHALEEMLGEDLGDLNLDTEEDLEDFEEEGDDFDEEDDDWADGEEVTPTVKSRIKIQVLPFSEATLPRICYLVVDRAAELVTPLLREFGDLGTIPTDEIQQKTLPIFDNHRVARRFSKRSQRVIKIPDGKMLEKTGACLEAKGIKRLLINGQVYALES
ncbi:transposase [Oscillatoria sp. FACHB-1406]|uniref:transposase n=1 Tax=Oscillatoria sp. FACHB-1406 TaxID=2692846 RepID=UPI001688B66C|nr:transposase [Oscillatoria sp. FACHB-1406]MBD2578236.1 transposase [Oscillatoria sp. FACHB-1406]